MLHKFCKQFGCRNKETKNVTAAAASPAAAIQQHLRNTHALTFLISNRSKKFLEHPTTEKKRK